MPRNSRRIAALAVGLVTMLALGAGTAQAFDYQSTPNGSPGWVSAHSVGLASASNDVFANSLTTAWIGFDSLWLYPSPATSQTQIVTVRNAINTCGVPYIGDDRIAYQCTTMGSSTASWYVGPGDWTGISNRSPLNVNFIFHSGWRYYSQLTITWRTLSGAYLGQKVINYRDAADGACHTAQCTWSGTGSSFWGYGFTSL